jgi:zinc and cadmium transporter
VTDPGISLAAAATLTALVSALAALWLTGVRHRIRMMVPLSAGMLIGVAAFGLLPDVSSALGWARAALLFLGGYLLLFGINRFVYPVCPSCSHGHDHSGCDMLLHGFAAPLIAAAAIHSFFDGWSVMGAQTTMSDNLHLAVPIAIAIHKVPEGIALGSILRAAVPSRLSAFGWCALGECPTMIGALFASWVAPALGFGWAGYPLALAAGALFFLGSHAVHTEWRRRGPAPALYPAMAGLAGVAALQQGVHALL